MPEYNCNLCNFNTNLRANYARHLTTKKHLKTLISTGEKNKNKQQTLIHSSKTLNSECNFPQFSLKNPQKPQLTLILTLILLKKYIANIVVNNIQEKII